MLRKSREEILKTLRHRQHRGKSQQVLELVQVLQQNVVKKQTLICSSFTTLDVSEWQEEVLYQEFFLTVMPMPSFRKWGQEVLPIVKKTPVLAGVCGTDPFRVMDIFLKQLKEQGFNGVQNFPTVGLIDGKFQCKFRGNRNGIWS